MALNDSQTRLPLYLQISELLQREIAAGHWLTGERLPTESQLAQDLGVAVGTLRKALSKLENDGFLERRQGSGTYVTKPPEGGAIYQFFRLELLKGGGLPTAKILSVDAIKNPEIARIFGHGEADRTLWRIRRLRFLSREPIASEEIWIDGRHADELSPDTLHESLYMHYRTVFNFWVTHVSDEVSCQAAPDWACDNLKLPHDSVCGWAARRSWANNGQIEEFSNTWFDPSVCRYVARWS